MDLPLGYFVLEKKKSKGVQIKEVIIHVEAIPKSYHGLEGSQSQ